MKLVNKAINWLSRGWCPNRLVSPPPKTFLQNRLVYLGGPIEMAETDKPNWREEPKKILRKEFGLNVFDPFEDPKQQWVNPLLEAREKCDYETMASIAKKFVQKDLTVVDNSNMLIAYLPHKVPTTGTHHEIIRSSDAKKPTLLVTDGHKKNIPLWYHAFVPHTVMFGNWDDLYEYLREVNEGKHKNNRRWNFIYGLI